MDKSVEEQRWEDERNIVIVSPTLQDLEELNEFSKKNYYPDEPMTFGSKILERGSFFARQMEKLMFEEFMVKPIKSNLKVPSCLVARDKTSGKIVAMRIGDIKRRSPEVMREIEKEPNFRFLGNLPKFIPIPRELVIAGNLQWVMDQISYSRKEAFDRFENDEAIYFAVTITVGREARGKGIGKELISRTMRMAEKAGCGHTFVLATSVYSQGIFKNLGYDILCEKSYEEFKVDRKGRPLLVNMRQHKTVQTLAYDHTKKR